MSMPSLTGRRVLELGGYLAAPFAGRMLAQLGADVIKIEALAGDPSRHLQSPGTFIALNIGKRSMCIDLRSVEGRAIFDRLLANSEVVLHNLSPDAIRHLKLTSDDCRRVNPDIVYCRVSGYGPGPLENEIATNPAIEASTGVMFSNRVDGRPIRQGLPYYDMAAGAYAVIGVLSALVSKSDDKESRTVQVPLYETGLYLAAAHLLSEQLRAPANIPSPGRSEFSMPGYGAYETADGRWIYLIMLSDGSWRQFCEVMSLSSQIDPALASGAERLARKDYVEELVRGTIRELSFEETAGRLRSVGFGFEEVRSSGEVLDHPQARHPGKLMSVPLNGRNYAVPTFPILSGSVRPEVEGSPPLIGQHSLEILQMLGYDVAQCDAFLERGVIAVPQQDRESPLRSP